MKEGGLGMRILLQYLSKTISVGWTRSMNLRLPNIKQVEITMEK